MRMDPAGRIHDEAALRRAVLRGDEGAWRALFDRTLAPVHAFVRCRVRDPAGADEVVQEAFLVAVRRMRRFDPARASFETWLTGIAANVLRNHARRSERRRRVEGAPLARAVEGAASANAGREPDLRDRIARALTTLSARYRAVLRAKYEEGRSVASIASSPKAVESLLSRARAAFRRAFEQMDRETGS